MSTHIFLLLVSFIGSSLWLTTFFFAFVYYYLHNSHLKGTACQNKVPGVNIPVFLLESYVLISRVGDNPKKVNFYYPNRNRTNGHMCPSNSNSAAFIIPIKTAKINQKEQIESFFTVTGDLHQASIIKVWGIFKGLHSVLI